MVRNDWKWIKINFGMVRNGWSWLVKTENRRYWIEMAEKAENGWNHLKQLEWLKMGLKWLQRIQINYSCCTWLITIVNGWTLLDQLQMVGNGSKRQAVNEWKWIVILEWLDMAVNCWK